MWFIAEKEVAIVINSTQLQLIIFRDRSKNQDRSLIEKIEEGIYLNPDLSRKEYTFLLQLFHPDVSSYQKETATTISKIITSAKSGFKQTPKIQWKKQYSFETILKNIPQHIWDKFGATGWAKESGERFQLIKNQNYDFFETRLLLFYQERIGYCVSEYVISINWQIRRNFYKVDFHSLDKNILYKIYDAEKVSYDRRWVMQPLVRTFLEYCCSVFVHQEVSNKWKVEIADNEITKSEFILPHYLDEFENAIFESPQKIEYLNCGQYLKLLKRNLERHEFLDFIKEAAKTAKKHEIATVDCEGYPGYPRRLLDIALQATMFTSIKSYSDRL